MSDHEIVFSMSGYWLQSKIVCNADDTASCRNMPKCQCEAWDIQKDKQGWFHTVGDEPGDAPGEVIYHRHTEPSDCNVCEWLNADDPMECIVKSVVHFDIASIPIKSIWTGDYYEWEPLKEQSE